MHKPAPALWARLSGIAVLSLLLLAAACGKKEEPVPQAAQVVTATALAKDTPQVIPAVGNVLASVSVSVKSRQDGHIIKIHFLDGDMVKAGQLLYTIDPVSQTLSKAQAEADLAGQRASAQLAMAEYNRYKSLYAQGVVSKEEYDQHRTAAETATAQVNTATASVGIAAQTLSYNYINAPNDGCISLTDLQEGNVVVANLDELAVINTVTPVDLSFSLPGRYLDQVRSAFQSGPVRVQAYNRMQDEAPVTGTLRAIDNSINAATGMFEMRARFENADLALWPGQFVGVGLVVGVRAGALCIPAKALQTGPDGDFVFIVRQGKAEMSAVNVDFAAGEDVVIKDGIAAGDEVVIEGQGRLRPGMSVTTARPQPPAKGATTP